MKSEAWSRIEELFQAARAQPPEKRSEFLNRSCSNDPALRSEVESLLKAADDSLLDGSPFSSVQPAANGLALGSKLGHFEIMATLGRGGMGDVYRARDVRLGREVALKVLPPIFADDRDRLARFDQEARAASALNHPNIVSVFDAGSSDGVFWIASELVDGETLAEALTAGPVPLRRLIDIASQIAAALAAAHAVGIVHRDLKPANVMLTRDSRVKVLDFGLAKQRRAVEARARTSLPTESLTLPGVAMGTPGYMSPEQVRGAAIDPRSDIFGFGAILYEMASGHRAFPGDSSVAVMSAILRDEPEDLPSEIPPVLERIVRRCLQKDPAQRFQSAADLQFALDTASGSRSLPQPMLTRKTWPRIAGFSLACSLVAAALVYWTIGLRPMSIPVQNTILRQVTFDHGLTADPAISPDGKLLAYASDRAGSGNLDIWLKQVDGGDPVALTNDPANDDDPNFSPDGTRIAFVSERNGGGIYVMPALGGDASLLVSKAWRPRFSPDGRYLLYITGVPPERIGLDSAGNEVRALPLTGGAPVDLSKGCSIVTTTPLWSPDGHRALFHAMCGGRWDIWSADPSGTGPQPTHWAEYASHYQVEELSLSGIGLEGWLEHPLRLLLRARAGTADYLLALPASADGLAGVGPPERVTFGTGAEVQASVAANGRVAIGSLAYEAHIWGVPVDDSGKPTGAMRRLTNELPGETEPVLSANGEHLVFVASKAVPVQVYGKDLATRHVRQLSSDDAAVKMSAAIDKDGSRVLYFNEAHAGSGLYSVPFAGGVPQKLATVGVQGTPSDWARDGRSVLLLRFPVAPSRHFAIDALELASGRVISLLADADRDLFEPHFSPNEQWVTFTVLDGGRSRVFIAPWRSVSVPPSEWRPIASDAFWNDKPRFSNDGLSVLFTSDRDGFRCVWGQRLTPDMQPTGNPFAVYHSHGSQLSIRNSPLSDQGMSVGKGWLVFDQTELKGNIWMLEAASLAPEHKQQNQ